MESGDDEFLSRGPNTGGYDDDEVVEDLIDLVADEEELGDKMD